MIERTPKSDAMQQKKKQNNKTTPATATVLIHIRGDDKCAANTTARCLSWLGVEYDWMTVTKPIDQYIACVLYVVYEYEIYEQKLKFTLRKTRLSVEHTQQVKHERLHNFQK